MADSRIMIDTHNGGRIWLNPQQILKMEKTPDGRYFVYMPNGEIFEIGSRAASNLEDYFEDLH